jgi:predicted nucleotidyltransferase
MVRTEQGPLRSLWARLHGGLLALVLALVRRGEPGAAVYLRGSFASGDPVYGLSDLDLVAVVPGAGGARRERLDRRWARACRAVPGLERVAAVKVYEEPELADAAASTALSYGLEGEVARPLFEGVDRHHFLRVRPNLYGPTRDWRHVAGPERRPDVAAPAGSDRLVAAWLELQCWWRYVAWTCRRPTDRGVTYFCFKFVAEAARTWLWVAHGVRAEGRADALRRALPLMPADEPILTRALAARGRLARPGELELAEVVPWLADFSSRLAAFVSAELEPAGWTEVRLRWNGDGAGGRLPLADWRALVLGEDPDATFVLDGASPGDPGAVARAAAAEERGTTVALPAPGILVLPSDDLESRRYTRGTLRAIQCDASDPVSLALARGERVARFPDVPGWSARDWARRAVAEHRVRVRRGGGDRATLLAAARAALFLASLEDGAPELRLSAADVEEALDGGALDRTVDRMAAFAATG